MLECSVRYRYSTEWILYLQMLALWTQISETSLILDENRNMSRTGQLSAGSAQDLDLRSKFEPPTRDEADGHLQLPCFTTLDFSERNSLQDPLVDHMLFGFKERVCSEN